MVAGGPQTDYPPAVVNALKSYVEGGGRAMFMLDLTLKLGRGTPAAENPDLMKVLADWGVTVNKDLSLDLSGIGQLFGLGPEVPLIAEYQSHAITQPLGHVPTAFPLVALARRQVRRQDHGRQADSDYRRQLRHYRDQWRRGRSQKG